MIFVKKKSLTKILDGKKIPTYITQPSYVVIVVVQCILFSRVNAFETHIIIIIIIIIQIIITIVLYIISIAIVITMTIPRGVPGRE